MKFNEIVEFGKNTISFFSKIPFKSYLTLFLSVIATILLACATFSFYQTFYLDKRGLLYLYDLQDKYRLLSETGLAVLSTFISAILSISLPISLDVISNVDKKYNLNVLTTKFIDEIVFKLLVYILFLNTFLIFINLIGYNIFFVITTLIISIIAVVIFGFYIKCILVYSSNVKLKEKLEKEFVKNIERLPNAESSEYAIGKIYKSLELLSGVSLCEVYSGDYSSAKDSVHYLVRNFKRFIFDLKFGSSNLQKRYLGSFLEFWKKAYTNERSDLSLLIVQELKKIFIEIAFKQNYDVLSYGILEVYNSIIYYSVRKNDIPIDNSIPNSAFVWYDSLQYKIEESLDEVHENMDDLLNSYQSYLWNNLKDIMINNRMDVMPRYYSLLFNGYPYFFSSPPYLTFEYNDLMKDIDKLSDECKDISSFSQVKNWLGKYSKWSEDVKLKLKSSEYDRVKYSIKDFKKQPLTFLLIHKQKEFVNALASMALYYKRYDFITELWGYRQPNDTIAINGGNDILPQSLLEIFKFYFQINNIPFFKYHLEANHDIQVYMRKYSILLFLRQYTLQSFLITDNHLGYDYIPSNLEHEEAHLWMNEMDQFKNLFKYVQSDRELLKNLKLDFSIPENIESPETIIEKLKDLLKEKIKQDIQRSPLDEEYIDQFFKTVSDRYNGRANFRSILDYYGLISEKESVQEQSLGIFNFIEKKDPFSKLGDPVFHIDHGAGYGWQLASNEDFEYYQVLDRLCSESKIECSIEELGSVLKKDLKSDIVILSINFSFGFDLTEGKDNFTSKSFLNDPLEHDLYQGDYNGVPVFMIRNPHYSKKIFLIHKDSLPKIIDYSFEHPEGLKRITKSVYQSINKNGNDVEINLRNYAEITNPSEFEGCLISIKA
ncbi:hypothetical protein [Marinifilum sp. D714]|uniref:hypothetical protein n=1 Tax=Marinifilum sp. D714 TaxID=2937523 RepID=UPI0027CBE3C9|nr:hypothetical protein [Marinifilum sp. D714]MDQ2180677.1 hypothetical protein [Marinifilum sp. D714]